MINDQLDGLYGYFLSDRNGVRGSNDYAYDELYLGRSETQFFLSQQMALRQGAFKIYTPFGAYREWIIAANFIDFPIPLPLKYMEILEPPVISRKTSKTSMILMLHSATMLAYASA